MRGAIIGFGEVARHGHWPAYARSRDVRIVAVVDRTASRRALAESLIPEVGTFAAFDDLANAVTLDFVDVCTPPALHPQPMLFAIAHGWHVLCEKPFVIDPVVLDVIRAEAEAAGVAVVPVHNWKYAPIIQHATRFCRAGLIGPLRTVDIDVSRLRAAATADEAPHANWRRDPAVAGGGILMDHGWHAVYLALHWFGEEVTGVTASLHRPAGDAAEDEAAVTLTFPSGAASIRLTWNGEVRRNRIVLSGELGEIVIDDDVLQVSGACPASIRMPRALSAGSHHDDWFSAMLPDVVAAFRDVECARPRFEEAGRCLAAIRQAYANDASLPGQLLP
jgi:predicted dehydrogenase